WGELVLALGVVSGILGVAFAIGQHDVKRLLAYHSIENIGIIIMGLGLALLGRSLGRADFVLLGLAGGLLHVWNHCLFTSLLFLGSPRSEHAEHAHESGPAMIGPMAVLGGCCLFIGVLPQVVAPLLERAAMVWAPTMVSEGSLSGLAPLGTVSVMALVLLGALA